MTWRESAAIDGLTRAFLPIMVHASGCHWDSVYCETVPDTPYTSSQILTNVMAVLVPVFQMKKVRLR